MCTRRRHCCLAAARTAVTTPSRALLCASRSSLTGSSCNGSKRSACACVCGTPPLPLGPAASRRRAHAHTSVPPPPPGPVAAAVAKCYRTWHAAVASLPSPLGPAVAEHTRMRQRGPPPAPLAPYSTSSLNAAAARRPVTRDTLISDHALISDDPHVSDDPVTDDSPPALGFAERGARYVGVVLRPSSAPAPKLAAQPLAASPPAVRRAARCAWAVSLARCNRD